MKVAVGVARIAQIETRITTGGREAARRLIFKSVVIADVVGIEVHARAVQAAHGELDSGLGAVERGVAWTSQVEAIEHTVAARPVPRIGPTGWRRPDRAVAGVEHVAGAKVHR